MIKISLIITTYNNPFLLGKVLDSVMRQSRLPDELLIADDGSDEQTASLVNSFSEGIGCPVIHVWQENRGFRAAKIRNEALKRTSGDYIILLDGDCIVNTHFISDHLALAEQGCFIQGKRVHVGKGAIDFFNHEHANSLPKLISLGLRRRISNVHHLIRLPIYLAVKNTRLKGIKSCNMSFFKSDIIAVNGFNEDFIGWGNEDSDLVCRFFRYGLRKKIHPFMAICFHMWHPRNHGFTLGNKHLLEATLRSNGFYCKNGIVKEH